MLECNNYNSVFNWVSLIRLMMSWACTVMICNSIFICQFSKISFRLPSVGQSRGAGGSTECFFSFAKFQAVC